MWHRGEVGRVRFNEQPIFRYKAEQIIVAPFLEGDDSAERDVPARIQCVLRQCVRPCVTMEHASHPGRTRFTDHGEGVILGIAGMHNKRLMYFCREGDLSLKRRQLRFAGRIIVVVVEPAFADGNGGFPQQLTEARNIATGVESSGVVGMDPRGREDEAGIIRRVPRGKLRRRDRLPNAHDRLRARIAGARDYRVAVAGERWVREVGVAVDEVGRVPVLRGHLRSIHRSTGAAT